MKKINAFPAKTESEVELAESQIIELSKRIEFYLTEFSVELLAMKMKKGDFIVPSYQREYTWEHDRKSRFIESLVIGLPIPFLFFWEMPDGKLEIVDGSQRLRTIEEFVLGELRLGELNSLTALSGFRFQDLSPSRQMKIINRSIRGIVLNEHADEQARFDMFERINTGSKIANMAEIRRGALSGKFMELIIELAANQKFTALAPVSKKDKDEREREELVARFFAYSSGLHGYKDRPSEFIFNYVKEMNEKANADPLIITENKQRFIETIDFVEQVFPYGFRRNQKGKATPRARFEAIAVGTRLAIDSRPSIKPQDVLDVTSWMTKDDFAKVTGSDGANAIARLKERIEFVRDRLLKK